MCGICGFVPRSGKGIPDLDLLKRMAGRLQHRGPDSCGYYRDRHAALAHTRLSVIDIEGGAQPLSNERDDIWVTFNGEIFNYIELRHELCALGHVMRTQSDTEVIVHAWEQWGRECFSRFNGQWAIGIWDVRARTLILCRDRLGIRPLYYTVTPDRFLFASEVKSLIADPGVARSLDPAGLAELFTFWGPVAPRTVFRDVSEVRPGHTLELNADSLAADERCYWAISFPAAGDYAAADVAVEAERLRSRLTEVSRLRFTRSDVPVGAYLSGGLDSSVTSAVVAAQTDAPLTTFSLRFSDAEFDEGGYQQSMANLLGTEHHEVFVSRSDIGRVLPEVVYHAERPILRAAPAPLLLLSRLVRQRGYKVVVTGEGSDEVFAGYDIFRELKVRLFLARNPGSRKRAELLPRLYPWMVRAPGKAPAFAHAFFSRNTRLDDPAISHRPRWDTTAALTGLLEAELRAAVSAHRVDEELLARLPAQHARWDPIARAQWLEMTTLLPGYILSAQGDRMLMANSVEGRYPFLDHTLVEYAAALPMHLKLFALDEKHMLKLACADLVPPEILRRPKQPYRAPDAACFFGKAAPDWIDDLLAPAHVARARIFRPQAVEQLLQKSAQVDGVGMSNSDNMRLLGVVSTMLLHQQFIEGSGGGKTEHLNPMTVIDKA